MRLFRSTFLKVCDEEESGLSPILVTTILRVAVTNCLQPSSSVWELVEPKLNIVLQCQLGNVPQMQLQTWHALRETSVVFSAQWAMLASVSLCNQCRGHLIFDTISAEAVDTQLVFALSFQRAIFLDIGCTSMKPVAWLLLKLCFYQLLNVNDPCSTCSSPIV